METRFFDGFEAEFVGRAVGEPAFEAAAGHPHGVAVGIVVAAVAAFGNRRAPEFAAPDHQGGIEQAAALQGRG